MVASPWALGLQKTEVFDGTQVTDVAVGTVLMVQAGLFLALLAMPERNDAQGQAHRATETEDEHTR